jgi:hypothetical protein
MKTLKLFLAVGLLSSFAIAKSDVRKDAMGAADTTRLCNFGNETGHGIKGNNGPGGFSAEGTRGGFVEGTGTRGGRVENGGRPGVSGGGHEPVGTRNFVLVAMLQSDDKSQKDIQAEKAAAHEAREQMDKAAAARDRGDAKGAKEAADKAKEAADTRAAETKTLITTRKTLAMQLTMLLREIRNNQT